MRSGAEPIVLFANVQDIGVVKIFLQYFSNLQQFPVKSDFNGLNGILVAMLKLY